MWKPYFLTCTPEGRGCLTPPVLSLRVFAASWPRSFSFMVEFESGASRGILETTARCPRYKIREFNRRGAPYLFRAPEIKLFRSGPDIKERTARYVRLFSGSHNSRVFTSDADRSLRLRGSRAPIDCKIFAFIYWSAEAAPKKRLDYEANCALSDFMPHTGAHCCDPPVFPTFMATSVARAHVSHLARR